MGDSLDVESSCCFTGHRPKHFVFGRDESHPQCVAIKRFLRETILHLVEERGVTHFISGGALGVDTWAMEEVIALKKLHPGITLECALPYPEMAERFGAEDRARHDAALLGCDIVTAVSPSHDGRACLDRRNEYMVDRAKWLIAVWTGIMTGTGRAVRYAESPGRHVLRFDPSMP